MGERTNAGQAHHPPRDRGETVTQWTARWLAGREVRGLTSVRDDRCRLRKHVLEMVGDERMAGIDAGRIEDVRDALDVKVRAGELAWRTAHHVWGVVRAMFRDASRSKDRTLRVRADDACRDIEPPDRGLSKMKQFLFPSELVTLVSCARVPLSWRRIVALTTCLYLRVAELEALDWSDIELERATILVHRSLNRADGAEKPTKNGMVRRFLIEPTLMPLLRRIHRETGGRGRVVGELTIDRFGLARGLRDYLAVAGVDRAELFRDDPSGKRMTFHDLRATGITWMAVRGDDPLKIRQRAGHRNLATTERYIRVAEELRAGFGAVFPVLPESLLGT